MEEKEKKNRPLPHSRKSFLEKATLLAVGGFAMLTFGGCEEEEQEKYIASLEELNEEGSISADFNGDQIFLTRIEGEIIVFSLICRHKKCTIKWKADKNEFHCPCHEGIYDAKGNVLSGPPPGPLYQFKTELRKNEIWVINERV